LETRGVGVMSPERTFATADHNTPTIDQHLPVKDPLSANQLEEQEGGKHGRGKGYTNFVGQFLYAQRGD
ncbi:MAG: hypothetical protein D3910_22275, partial [Candidatus Electrothrix sp. ATG2]|nr:hypothetical protein [Candidatus Electrothrix sp. ATG2]